MRGPVYRKHRRELRRKAQLIVHRMKQANRELFPRWRRPQKARFIKIISESNLLLPEESTRTLPLRRSKP